MPFVVTCCAFKTHRANGRGRASVSPHSRLLNTTVPE
ncbi:hypothetical protein GBAR_LOCUS25041 [Geodia barretti]|uniref:Uncharacterized protein n=1 Tax=Geodia barretti TaxID=519541 RepID=A0AA35XBX9_GEOBA|nr:hypothetical protein GBAR_LOCUS25041 [Geodia barretti]